MVIAIAVFTILTGTASLLGFLYIFIGKNEFFKKLCAILFVFAFIWSGYILLYPTSTVRNVAAKVILYKDPTIEQPSNNLVIQRGAFSIYGFEPQAVEFEHPFKDKPEVEVININGYSEQYIPRVLKVTPHQVVFKSSTSGGLAFSRQYNWVARGTPLEAINK